MGRRLPPDRRLRELEAIYREHHRRVRWTMRARAVPEGELDDLVHDAFVAIFARMHDRDPSLPMATWVVGVARNVAFSHRRSYARRRNAPQLEAPLPDPSPDEALARRRAWGMVEDFLAQLDATQREVFVLADVMGMRIPEVAGIVDAPLNTLYSRLRIARRRFSERFGDAAEDALREAAQGEAPRRDEVQRAWLALAGSLVPAAAPTLVLGGATAKWVLAGVAAVGVATVITIAPRDDPPRRSSPARDDLPTIVEST
ncbi:MAG TPA: sigma-70 family RNA polymerase sigma factor, partial [Nannocystaceae bacterium]|nr:sigma-70 family RNA polymerase sigma factor [Nannocystaceae bacterium]